MIATKPYTAEEAAACNARAMRAKNFLLHADARPLMTVTGPLTSREMNERRLDALQNMRSVCGACGLCKRHGIPTP